MDEPVSLVLDFLRQHNFEKAEEALRLELHARHSFARPTNSHNKVEVVSQEGGIVALNCQGNATSSVDETAFHISLLKPESDIPSKSGLVDSEMDAYTEWEFKSCSNNDCVLEFKKHDPRLRRMLMEVSSSNNHDVRRNSMKPINNVHKESGIGRQTGHDCKNGELLCDSENGMAIGLALCQKQQHDFERTCDHLSRMKACKSGQLQQDLGSFEITKCFCMDEPMPVLPNAVFEVKAFSPQSNVQNFARSVNHSFSDTSWLDHGVLDDDALKLSNFTEPSLHPVPISEEFEQLEEKRVVHDCIDYIKALTLKNQTFPPDLFKDIPLPWEMQNHYLEGEFLNERQTQDCYNAPSSNLRSISGSVSITNGITDSFGLDKLHTNALFEPVFNLGSFLDIPVGQGIASPGEKHESGVCGLSYSENAMQDTPELLSGFATLGDEPTDPGMGYSKEYWDSDMYEDDEDPGYERREIEDEGWFLAHEIVYPVEDDKVMVKERIDEDLLSQSNGRSEMVQGKEDSFLYTRELLDPGVSSGSQAKSDLDISSITTLMGDSSACDALNLKQFGSMSYDGHLMDAEELKFMRIEPVWQSFSSQFDKHVHFDKVDEGEAYDKPSKDCLREIDSRSDTQMKKPTQGSKFRRESLDETHGQSNDGFDQIVYRHNQGTCSAEAIRHLNGIQNPLTMSTAIKEACQFSHVSNVGDALSCIAPLDMQAINGGKPVPGGFFFNLPESNQGINGCPPLSLESCPFSQERHPEVLKSEDTGTLRKQENGELPPVPALENGTSSNPAFFSHPNVYTPVSFHNELYEARNEGTTVYTYDSAVNEPAVDDGETSTAQEEAQLLKTEDDEYEVFSLRIIHRKNRTGFEEEKHFQVVLNSVIAGRYLITEYLGSAAFSKAVQARDLQTGMDVCMKIIKNNKDFFDQSLDEIKLLKYINKNDPADKYHLLRLYDYFYHREHLFIVCELLRANLYEFHKFNKESGGEPYFTMSRLQSITRQCLEALEFLHCLGLIHCDLKPENILIKSYSRCEIKVIDLGSSCFQTDHLCSYVQSRSYRAPEVILGLPYDQKIDIWSLGCILAELCSGNVLFQNDSLATLLARVIGIIEPVMPEMILKGKEAHKYFTRNSMLYQRNQDTNKMEYLIPKKSSLRHRLPLGDQGFVDFVGYLLQVNPENRPSASEALKHPWLTHPYEPVC